MRELSSNCGGNQRLTVRWVGDEAHVYDTETRRICFLNSTAARVWKLSSKGQTTEQIVGAMCEMYADADETRIRKDVEHCLHELRDLGLAGHVCQGIEEAPDGAE